MKKNKETFFNMQTLTAGITTMLVLWLLGLVMFFVISAGNLADYVRENIGLTVTLADDTTEPQALKLQRTLNEETFVKQTEYISKEQALKEQTEAMGTDPAEFLGYNPFTPAIEIRLKAPYANPDSIACIVREIKAYKQVVEVTYPQELLSSVNRNLRRVSLFLLAIAALLTLVSFALISNTVRLAIYARRFLIHTMKLVGASPSFVRRPFLTRHLWTGLTAGITADVLLMFPAWMAVRYEPRLIEIITPQTLLTVMLAVPLFGVIITGMCAYISVGKFLRIKADALYRL